MESLLNPLRLNFLIRLVALTIIQNPEKVRPLRLPISVEKIKKTGKQK